MYYFRESDMREDFHLLAVDSGTNVLMPPTGIQCNCGNSSHLLTLSVVFSTPKCTLVGSYVLACGLRP